MSELNEQQLATLAKLCRLELSTAELARLAVDFRNILRYVEQINAVDVSDLTPQKDLQELSGNSLRPDEIEGVLPRPVFLANAPDHVGGMIRVPTVLHHASKNS